MSRRPTSRACALSHPAAERGLLGCFLRRPADVALVGDRNLFTEPRHGTILDVLRELHTTNGGGVDMWGVVERLPEHRDYLLDLVDDDKNPAAVTPLPLLRMLQECAARRRLDSLVKALQGRIADGDSPAEVSGFLRSQLAQDDTCPAPSRFRLLDDAAIAALPPPEPLAGELLAADTLAVHYGASGSAKSFLALDLSLSIAAGSACLGYEVQRGTVVYIAAEGAAGLGVRVHAWKQRHGYAADQRLGVHFVPEAVNLLSAADVDALVAVLAALPEHPVLLVVDTFARCLVGGDENSAKDVGLAIAALDRVRRVIGCTVLVVHHTGKNVGIERGSSALRAAADTMLAVAKDGDAITLRCEKQKNAAPFEDVSVRLVPVDLGDGETSCVLTLATPKPGDLSGTRAKALHVLATLFDEDGATFTQWAKAGPFAESTLLRAIHDLHHAGHVEKPPPKTRGGKYRATEAGKAAAEALTTKARGGERAAQEQRFSARCQSPPPHHHGGDRPSPPPPPPPYKGGGVAVDGVGVAPEDAFATFPGARISTSNGVPVDGATLLALAEERGFPGLPLRPGVAVPAGAAAWDTFTRCGTVEDLAAAWAALGGGGLPSA